MIPIIDVNDVQTRAPRLDLPKRKLLRHIGDGDFVLEIDNSSFESYVQCARSAQHKLVYSRIAEPKYALVYGRAVHAFLEAYYKHLKEHKTNEGFDFEKVIQQVEKIFIEQPAPAGEWRTFAKLIETMRNYITTHRQENFQIHLVEQGFSVPFMTMDLNQFVHYDPSLVVSNPETLPQPSARENSDLAETPADSHRFFIRKLHISWTGVIDLIVSTDEGYWILDHKTTSIEGESFWRTFELSPQFLGYCWATQQITKMEVKGAIANVIYGRPKPVKGPPKDQLLRRFYSYSQEAIENWHANTRVLVERFVCSFTQREFPQNLYHCVNKFGICPYHDVCVLPSKAQLPMLLSDQYYDNQWNPLDS